MLELDAGRDETMTAAAAYTDAELERIAAAGFNAIWVHGLLRNLVTTSVFPEFGRRADAHQAAMNTLVERAARHGVKVFIYMQPPRAVAATDAFWEKHGDIGGSVEKWREPQTGFIDMRSLCTSTGKVRAFLRESSESLTRGIPGLGGLILITASEYPSHCWARRGRVIDEMGHPTPFRKPDCPRCAERSPGEVVSEIIGLVRDGAKAGDPGVELIAWNWSWNAYEADPSPGIIRALQRDVLLMADFERGGHKTILGQERVIDEYSLSYIGPSQRFTAVRECAAEAGIRVMAKLQIGTTHELATVPNLPLIGNLMAKARYCRRNDLCGFVGCWNFGNRLSANTAAFNFGLTEDTFDDSREAMERFAASYFPGSDPARVADGWETFGKAMDHYPFSIPLLYSSPVNHTLAYPLRPGPSDGVPCGGSWRQETERGDCLEGTHEPYTIDEVIEGFTRVHRGWLAGLDSLEAGLAGSDSPHATLERNTARVCLHVFRSARNTYRCWKLRRNWKPSYESEYQTIARDELANLREVLPLLRDDPRQGFHGEAFVHMFSPGQVEAKIDDLRALLAALQASSADSAIL